MKKNLISIISSVLAVSVLSVSICASAAAAVTVSKKGEYLYDSTLKSLEDRISDSGYAQTSLTGEYDGMYVRDAAAHVLAETANGNYKRSKDILNYIYEYHTLTKAEYANTTISELNTVYTDNNYTNALKSGDIFENYSQLNSDKTVAELNENSIYACKITASTDIIQALNIFLHGYYSEFFISLAVKNEDNSGFDTLGDLSFAEDYEASGWKMFLFSRPFNLELGKEYYLLFSAVVPEGKKLYILGAPDCGENYYYNNAVYGDNWMITTDGPAMKTYTSHPQNLSFDIDYLTMNLPIDETHTVMQEIKSKGKKISEITVYIMRYKGVTEPLIATLYSDSDKKNLIDKTEVPLNEISEYGDYLKLKFDFVKETAVPDSYFLELSTLNKGENCFCWFGAESVETLQTYTFTDKKKEHVNGEMSFYAGSVEVPEVTPTTAQSDCTFILLHAFADWFKNNSSDEDAAAFAEKVWPKFSQFANTFLTDKYYSERFNLIYNPEFEHINRNYRSYDLVTNVFASQALYEMSKIAEQLKKTEDSAKWAEYSSKIKDGINNHLVTDYNGKKIYCEMIDRQNDYSLVAGFSFINLAPAAADWYGTDNEILKNTYEAYLNTAVIKIGDYPLGDAKFNISTSKSSGYVLGKGAAWEILTAARIKNLDRVSLVLDFLDKYNENIYAEKWAADGKPVDIGNQEQCSWLVYSMAKTFPSLAKYIYIENSTDSIDISIQENPTEQIQEKSSRIPTVLKIILIAAGFTIIVCAVIVIINNRTGMNAYAKAVAMKNLREGRTVEEFKVDGVEEDPDSADEELDLDLDTDTNSFFDYKNFFK